MKVHSPAEDKTDQENVENEKNEEELKICSPIDRPSNPANNPFTVTANPFSTNFSGSPFASSQKLSSSSRCVLKPPQLSVNNSSGSGFTLNTSKLNPFAKAPSTDNGENKDSKTTFVLNPSKLNPVVAEIKEPKKDEPKQSDDKSVQNGETPKFVPLIQSDSKPQAASTSSTSSIPSANITSNSFVFGQNLEERVITEGQASEPKPSTSVNSNGTEMLFSSAVSQEAKQDNGVAGKEAKSLSESAREYEESRAVKRKFEEVETKTGEEEETNVLNILCKLFSYDKAAGSWQERGRGTLRLNDFEDGIDWKHSRLVFRTSGTLRVVLNTKVWAEMTVEKASERSVRLTALDTNGEIKVFLIMASTADTTQLFTRLQSRVQREVDAQKRRKVTNDDE